MNARRTPARPRPPLNAAKLEELGLRYVGRFATSRAKLCAYLARKVRERGWEDARQPDFDALADRFCALGYVDDAAYALAKSQSLAGRGYGKRRLEEKLRLDGIREEDSGAARSLADEQAVDAALKFAKRRRIGPFATGAGDPREQQKALAAFVRAGHPFNLAKAIVAMAPDTHADADELSQKIRLELN